MVVPLVSTVMFVRIPNLLLGVIGESTVVPTSVFIIVKGSAFRVRTAEAATLFKTFSKHSAIIISPYGIAACLVYNFAVYERKKMNFKKNPGVS